MPKNESPHHRAGGFRWMLMGLLMACTTEVWAEGHAYCSIEVGAKGVKARGFEFGYKGGEGDSSLHSFFEEEANIGLISSVKDGVLSDKAIAQAAKTVAELMKKIQAARADCKSIVVGSSAFALVKNADDLAAAVVATGAVPSMDFVNAEQEVEYGFVAAVPSKVWSTAVLIDTGSGNTKFGYRGTRGFEADDIPLGSVTLADKAGKGGEDFQGALKKVIDEDVRPGIRTASSRHPGLMNRAQVFWIGGAAWATATFMRPDQVTRTFVRLRAKDVRQFITDVRLATKRKPGDKASARVKTTFTNESARVLDTFPVNNMLAGASLMDAFLADRDDKDAPIFFARNVYWIQGYAAKKFGDDIWTEDDIREKE